MCTPWTATRIVRWRRKGLSSSTVFCCKHHHKHSDRFWIPPFTDGGDQPISTSVSHLFSEPGIYQLNKLQLEGQEEEEEDDYHQEHNHEEEKDENNISSSTSTSSHESNEKFSTGDEKLSSSDDCDQDESIPRYSAVTHEKFSTSSDDIDPSLPRYSAENELDSHSPNSPNFADGDYIVFCFKEGGAFDIVKDNQRSSPEVDSTDNTIVRLKSVNRKKQLIYNGEGNNNNNNNNIIVDKECLLQEDHTLLREEEEEEDDEEEEEKEEEEEELDKDNGKGNGNGNGIDLLTTTNSEWQSNTSDEKGNEDEDDDDDDRDTVYFDPESSVDIIKLDCSSSTNGDDHTIGNGSQSDSSTSSFAFPLLNTEWTGSPIKMPKLESMPKLQAMQLRRHRRLGLHCCKF